MKKKIDIKLIIIITIMLIFCAISLYSIQAKPVYMEFIEMSDVTSINNILIDNNNPYLKQTFKMPYEIFYGISLKTNNIQSETNHDYEIKITDITINEKILEKQFNTSEVKEDLYLDITVDKPIKIDISHTYELEINELAKGNSDFLSLSISKVKEESTLVFNNNVYENMSIVMNIFGGTTNSFWYVFVVVCNLILLSLGLYIYYLYKNKKTIKGNKIVQAAILGIIIFIMLFAFKNVPSFWDETDYIMSGLLISKGKILYVDYFTQHMPFASYLSAFIAFIFRAESVEQFRTAYYLIIALIYSFLYIRHSENFGKVKMFLIPIIFNIINTVFYYFYIMILGDNIQIICILALLLEFIQYLKDEKIDLKRSIIISACIFCSITSIFISVYQIFIIFLGFVIKEIIIWRRNKNFSFNKFFKRYGTLILICIIPFLIFIIHLIATNSLYNMYEQAYLFNRKVYSKYGVLMKSENFGTNIFQPFYTGIVNFFMIIPEAVSDIFLGDEIFIPIIKIVLVVYFVIINIINLDNKRYLLVATLFMFVFVSFSRDNNNFHTLSAWGIIILSIIIYIDIIKRKKKMQYFILGFIILVALSSYLKMYYEQIQKPIALISIEELIVIKETNENDVIFHDVYSDISLFYIYKNRLPINRMTFILPWYMEWYQDSAVEDLLKNKPKVVLYDEMYETYGVEGNYYYAPKFKKSLLQGYNKISENSRIWIRKDI